MNIFIKQKLNFKISIITDRPHEICRTKNLHQANIFQNYFSEPNKHFSTTRKHLLVIKPKKKLTKHIKKSASTGGHSHEKQAYASGRVLEPFYIVTALGLAGEIWA